MNCLSCPTQRTVSNPKQIAVPYGTRWLAGVAISLPLVLAVTPAQAQQTPAAPSEEVVELEEFQVEGFKEGLAKAMQDQRDSGYLKDVLSSDSFGKLPDNNAAEALSRLPGIFLTPEQGEGRYVSIRGMEPDLNNVTVNGQTIAASDSNGRSGRAPPMDVLSAAAVSRIEVIKATTPDMDGQSIGGTINIVAPSAFDYKGTYLFGSGEIGYNDQCTDCSLYSGDFNLATRIGEQLGVYLGINYSSKETTSYLAHGGDWYATGGAMLFYDPAIDGTLGVDTNGDPINVPGSNPDGTHQTGGPLLLPEDMTLGALASQRERLGVNANIQWRPNDNTEMWFRGYYTSYDDEWTRTETRIRLREDITSGSRGRLTSPTSGFVTRARNSIEHHYQQQERPVTQAVIGGKHNIGAAWTIDGNLNFTNAKETVPVLYRFESLPECNNGGTGLGAIPENACATLDWSDPTFHVYEIFNSPSSSGGWANPNSTGLGDLDFWPVTRIRRDISFVEEDTWTADVNLKWEGELFGHSGIIKTGYKRLERDKSVDDTALQFRRDQSGAPILFYTDTAGDGSDGTYGAFQQDLTRLGSIPYGPSAYGNILGPVSNMAAFLNDEALYIGSPNPFASSSFDILNSTPEEAAALFPPGSPYTFDSTGARSNSVEDDYDINEVIQAAYLMASVNFGENFNVIAGVRVEWTDGTISGFPRIGGDTPVNEGELGGIAIERFTATKSYENVLPSIHFKWDATDKLVVRGSFTTNLARPDFTDIRPAGEFNVNFASAIDPNDSSNIVEQDNYYVGNLDAGNPGLDPYESKNYDISAAYYFENGSGLISVGYFYKKIDNAIYEFDYSPTSPNDPNRDRQIDAEPVVRGTVTDSFGRTIEVVTIRGYDFEEFDVTDFNNAESGFVEGIEISVQKNFDFLPAPFDGFGVAANMSFIDSGVTIFQRPGEELPFFQQPDEVINIQAYYQYGPFEARLAWRKQGEALVVVGGSDLNDTYSSDYSNLDFKLSYQFTDNLGAYFAVRNITDEPLRHHPGGDTNRPSVAFDERPGYETYGTTYSIGVNWGFGQR